MNRKNLLITLALFAFTPSAMAANCVAEYRPGKMTASPTNPASCYSSGKWSGKWEIRAADGGVQTGNMVGGKMQGKWEIRSAISGTVATGNIVDDKHQGKWEFRLTDGTVLTGKYVDGKQHGKWEARFSDGQVGIRNYINGKLQN